MTATMTGTACPKCGGAMWDNRERKQNPKAPDFKCKDKSCDGVIWPPRGQKAAPAPTPTAKQPVSLGGPLGEWDVIEGEEKAAVAAIQQAATPDRFAQLAALYDRCLTHALSHTPALIKSRVGDSPEAVSARAATLFIQANQRGLGQ